MVRLGTIQHPSSRSRNVQPCLEAHAHTKRPQCHLTSQGGNIHGTPPLYQTSPDNVVAYDVSKRLVFLLAQCCIPFSNGFVMTTTWFLHIGMNWVVGIASAGKEPWPTLKFGKIENCNRVMVRFLKLGFILRVW